MGKGIWIGLIVIALLAIGAFWIFGGEESSGGIRVIEPDSDSGQGNVAGSEENNENAGSATSPQTQTIEITSSGFSPKDLTIKKGDKVIWTNEGDRESWPASAMHPTHKVYPRSNIEKCGTAEEDNIFDACKGLKNGESYEFTFNEKGKWGYHDHLATSNFGSITVQ